MLTDLTVRNFAIVDQLQAQFGPGLNALTGETGAGKSILVDAINLLLGSRASSEMIRTGQEEAAVEAFFERGPGRPSPLLESLGVDPSEGLLIRRVVSRSGKSRAFVNGSPVTVHILEGLGQELVNIYGQHEHQDFLDPLRHIDILDSSGGLLSARNAYRQDFERWTLAATELRELTAKQEQRRDRLDFLAFQSGEIDRAKLKIGEDDELSAERGRLNHSEKLQSIAHFGAEVLYSENGSAVERLKSTLQRLREGARLDSSLEPLSAAVESTLFQAQDIASSLRAYGERVQFDPRRLEIVESRLDEISKLKKKYGPSTADVLAYKEKIDRERQDLGGIEEKISEVAKTASRLHEAAVASARNLSAGRIKAAQDLGGRVEKELSTLGMKKVRFGIEVEPESGEGSGGSPFPRLNEKGMDRVQFLLSPNPGEDLKALARIASGGELSRIMLAMKRIFAEESLVKTLIFDEVDAGIGGGVAEIVGRKLKEISRKHQVFCITHLPQIASLADAHFQVTKKEAGGRTCVEVKRLREEQRPEEIARMLGGIKITGKTLDHAREMLRNASKK